jgi:beta-aspartyl-peptidase (threonine type)
MILLAGDRRKFLKSAALVTGLVAMPASAQDRPAQRPRYAIALHGGAGRAAGETAPQVEAALGKALDAGIAVLDKGGASLDAVETVIRALEDDELFNAGRGAVFNSAGGHELDASIMDGRTLACGAVAALRTVRHPISLARLVMEKTRHVLLTSDGAEKFADELGAQIERVENAWFDTPRQRRDWERARTEQAKQSRGAGGPGIVPAHLGTVGCVALDAQGNLAAGTSTGGINNKKYGRVGDSPIIGAGTYANNATCAISCTGIGEQFIRHAVAYDISARLAYRHQPLAEAVHEVLHQTLRPGDGGLIALGADGTIAVDFSTAGMARAFADATGKREVRT